MKALEELFGKFDNLPVSVAEWIACPLNMREVLGLCHGLARVYLRIHYVAATVSTGDGVSTLALKPMGRGNQSLNQREPVWQWLHKVVTLSPQIIVLKTFDNLRGIDVNGDRY